MAPTPVRLVEVSAEARTDIPLEFGILLKGSRTSFEPACPLSLHQRREYCQIHEAPSALLGRSSVPSRVRVRESFERSPCTNVTVCEHVVGKLCSQELALEFKSCSAAVAHANSEEVAAMPLTFLAIGTSSHDASRRPMREEAKISQYSERAHRIEPYLPIVPELRNIKRQRAPGQESASAIMRQASS